MASDYIQINSCLEKKRLAPVNLQLSLTAAGLTDYTVYTPMYLHLYIAGWLGRWMPVEEEFQAEEEEEAKLVSFECLSLGRCEIAYMASAVFFLLISLQQKLDASISIWARKESAAFDN